MSVPDFECRLKKYRQLKELTQEQLAALVGVRRETIMRLKKCSITPRSSWPWIFRGLWMPQSRRSLFLSKRTAVPNGLKIKVVALGGGAVAGLLRLHE